MEDIHPYIESGILEQYALGELSPAEQAQVEAQAARHPEIRRELDEVTAALGFYAEAHALTPPAGMRDRVLGNVLGRLHEAPATPNAALRDETDALSAPRPAAAPADNVRPLNPVSAPVASSRSPWALAASVALLLSLIGNFVLYTRWQGANESLVALENQQARYAAANQVMERQLGTAREQNTILRSDEFKAVALAGTPAAPTARARVLYNVATKKVYLDVRSLPALPAGKQYQLWALDNGKPVDAGTLATATVAGDSLQQMKDIGSAQAFAMTVEPEGGSVNPTLATMTVIGNI